MPALRIGLAALASVAALAACDGPPVPHPTGGAHQPSADPAADAPAPAASADPNASIDPANAATGPAPPAGPLPPMTPRCATRLSIALSGKSPSPTTLVSTDLAGTIDSLIASPDFAERYARFINSEFNDAPATTPQEDPIYYLAKQIIATDKPWSDIFVGGYQVKATSDAMAVTADPNGLGYFRTDAWRKRYAGNEPQGVMLVGAFRILENTTGLELTPSVGQPGDDRTQKGRMASPCKSCHFDSWFALDKVARLLPTKKGQDDTVSFTPTTAGAQQLFGKTIADDKALLTALVSSDGWRFQQCREIFKFMYGRAENKCEAQTFDRCVDALTQKQTLRAAVAAVAKDPAVCR